MRTRTAATSLAIAVVSAVAATASAPAASAQGRTLTGEFCTHDGAQPAAGACISLSFGGETAQGYTDSTERTITLRPGVYWLTVNDTSTKHNFGLEAPGGSEEDITTVPDAPGPVTVKVDLTPGSWTLFCVPHRDMGMYVDLEVGGVDQVG